MRVQLCGSTRTARPRGPPARTKVGLAALQVVRGGGGRPVGSFRRRVRDAARAIVRDLYRSPDGRFVPNPRGGAGPTTTTATTTTTLLLYHYRTVIFRTRIRSFVLRVRARLWYGASPRRTKHAGSAPFDVVSRAPPTGKPRRLMLFKIRRRRTPSRPYRLSTYCAAKGRGCRSIIVRLPPLPGLSARIEIPFESHFAYIAFVRITPS